jgi:hypothetical protein
MLNETHIEKHEVCIKCQLLFLNDFRSQIRKDILPFLKGGQYPGMGGQYDPEWGGQYDPEYAEIKVILLKTVRKVQGFARKVQDFLFCIL